MNRQRLWRAAIVATLAVGTVGCNTSDTISPQTKTTLYVFAVFANPNVTVTVNGQPLGQITKQTPAGTMCPALAQKSAADGVLSFPVTLGTHYVIAWTFAGGGSDNDTFDATSDMVESDCLFEPISP